VRPSKLTGIAAAVTGSAAVVMVLLGIVLPPSVNHAPTASHAQVRAIVPSRTREPHEALTPSAGATRSPSAAAPTAVPFVGTSLPVIACKTTYANGDHARKLKPTEEVRLPERVGAELAVFATNSSRVLAPRGWKCVAEVGGNSSISMTVSAPGNDGQAITIEDAATSYGHILDLACPLFPKAAHLLRSELGLECPGSDPGELVRHVTRTVASFEDPALVAGVGEGSGGELAVLGAIRYVAGKEPTAAKISCGFMPTSDALCRVIVEDWIRRTG
jgi:hypothetical protein